MSDASGLDGGLDSGLEDFDDEDMMDVMARLDLEETVFDRTRTDYTGAVLDDEFQPVDEVELAEEGLLLDDPDRLGLELDGLRPPPAPDLDPDDVGWDLDEA